MVASALQLAGLSAFVVAVTLWLPLLGLAVAGLALLVVGVALEGR